MQLLEYLQVPQEAARSSGSKGVLVPVPDSWPSAGSISFESASLRYKLSLPEALSSVVLRIDAGAHVGIVGRTGAGKSSLLALLFRLVEPSAGQVTIDGVDISSLGLKRLRSAIGIVPQDPILFSGKLKSLSIPSDHVRDGPYVCPHHSHPDSEEL